MNSHHPIGEKTSDSACYVGGLHRNTEREYFRMKTVQGYFLYILLFFFNVKKKNGNVQIHLDNLWVFSDPEHFFLFSL